MMSPSIPYLLSIITFLPLLGALAIAFVGDDGSKKQIALGTTVVTFLVSLLLLTGWEGGQAGMQFVEDYAWLPEFNMHYHLGVDGISLFLVLLTTFVMP
ncbi:NADH dehydrogenase, partial [Litorilinea aerophila]